MIDGEQGVGTLVETTEPQLCGIIHDESKNSCFTFFTLQFSFVELVIYPNFRLILFTTDINR